VESTLIVGVDGVVGANLALSLSGLLPVTGVTLSGDVPDDLCELEDWDRADPSEPLAIVERLHPQRVVYAGEGAQSCWDDGYPADWSRAAEVALAWHSAAMSVGAQFTLISSDAVFTGPWMFHAENSQSVCPSREAVALREIERQITVRNPDALIVRTHAFGWSPGADRTPESCLERLLADLQAGRRPRLDCLRHASPILASDLAQVIGKAWSVGLSGVYHIAGAERVNPVQFARRLAHQFALPFGGETIAESLTDCVQGFGRGETSLQTRKIRRALGIGQPLVSEGIERLYEQHLNGHRDRLQGRMLAVGCRVA
jgi:dTDP-4-dehydrorhamnose reductase